MINGVLNIYKPKGFTSHDVVGKLRRISGQKKIGHTGTLDPEAVGVLPVCLGSATRLCDFLTHTAFLVLFAKVFHIWDTIPRFILTVLASVLLMTVVRKLNWKPL